MDISNQHVGVLHIYGGNNLRQHNIQRKAKSGNETRQKVRRIHLRHHIHQHLDTTFPLTSWSMDQWK